MSVSLKDSNEYAHDGFITIKTKKMKKLKINLSIATFCFALCSFFLLLNAEAQPTYSGTDEIQFTTQSYKQVLASAKAKHKKIFVDAYATWCAPCKQLRGTTFKDAKTAAYFNQHFINISIDVEKGDGVELAKTWQIEGLPTLLILDENGEIIASHIGYVDGEGLLEFAGEASGK